MTHLQHMQFLDAFDQESRKQGAGPVTAHLWNVELWHPTQLSRKVCRFLVTINGWVVFRQEADGYQPEKFNQETVNHVIERALRDMAGQSPIQHLLRYLEHVPTEKRVRMSFWDAANADRSSIYYPLLPFRNDQL